MSDPDYDDEFEKLMGGGSVPASGDDDEFDRIMSGTGSKSAPVTQNDAGLKKQLEKTGDWYSQHYGTGTDTAKTLGGGLLESLGAILGFAPEAQGAKLGARMLQQGASGGLGGAGAGLTHGDDAGDTGLKAMLGTVIGAALPMFLGGGAASADKASDVAGWLARKADNTKAGSTSRIRDDLIEKFGIQDGPDKLGELVRKYSPSSLFSPKTSAGHLATIEGQLSDEGSNLAAMTRQAGEEGADAAAPGAMQGAQNDMLSKAADLDTNAYSDSSAGVAKMLEALLNRSSAKPLPQTLEKLIGTKAQYADDAFRPVTGFADEDAKSQAALHAWQSMKDAERSALTPVTPDTAQRFGDSQKTFGELSSLSDSLKPRASADDAVGNAGSAMVGAAAGALMPGGQGLMGALTSGTNNAVRQMTGGVAHDLFSNVMHPASEGLGALGSRLDSASRAPWGSAVGAAEDAAATDQSRGHQSYDLVIEALKQNPRMLGSYGQQLQDSTDLKGDISRLMDDDDQFRRLVLQLQAGLASRQQ